MQPNVNTGILYLIPSFLGHIVPELLSQSTKEVLSGLSVFVVEELRSTRRFLRAAGYTRNFDEVQFFELDKHDPAQSLKPVLEWLGDGLSVGLISEAGCPAVADPGNALVALAHRNYFKVVPLPGPNSIIMMLMASGLNGQQFRFHGYLPQKPELRKPKLIQLAETALKTGETQIFIETPYRNAQVISDMVQYLPPEVLFCIAADLTGPDEFIQTKKVSYWKSHPPKLGKVPAVFALGKI